MKGKIFSIVGLVMGCISVSISVTALVFSAIGMVKSKRSKRRAASERGRFSAKGGGTADAVSPFLYYKGIPGRAGKPGGKRCRAGTPILPGGRSATRGV